MVRPRKIPKNFIPDVWSESDDSEPELDPVITQEAAPVITQEAAATSNEDSSENEAIPTDEEDEEIEENDNNYEQNPALEQLAKEWLLAEITHNVSK